MKNKIFNITTAEIEGIKSKVEQDSTGFLAEIDGKYISTLEEYLSCVSELFRFPMLSDDYKLSWDGYLDWIRDLDWLGKDSYTLIIHDYKSFLANDLELKKMIMDDFEEIILPWWQEDVEKFCVGGKAKPFNVYLVD